MARDVIAVYQAFVGRRDPETADADVPEGYFFFTCNHNDRFKKQLKYICSGALSDPPDMSFYTTVGRHPKTGLEIFKCHRNTSDLEGYHLGGSCVLFLLLVPSVTLKLRFCLFLPLQTWPQKPGPQKANVPVLPFSNRHAAATSGVYSAMLRNAATKTLTQTCFTAIWNFEIASTTCARS